MKTLALVLAIAAVAAAQKPLKKHKPAYIATSPGASLPEAAPQQAHYQAAAPQSHHGGFGGGSSFAAGIGKSAAKPTYPLLVSDTRTLNSDGTINFNYQADNGLHQGETVDSDGTRRGFYSYPGADGKLITVKYTAGKNGFVAEGDHLPTQPQSAPYDPKQESQDNYSGKQGSVGSFGGSGGHYSHTPVHHGGAYRQGHHGGHGGHQSHHGGNQYSHGSGHAGHGGASFANFPDFSSHFQGSSGGHHGGAPSYSAGAGRYQGAAHGHHGGHHGQVSGHPGGSSSFSSLGGLGHGGHGGHGAANFADLGSLSSQLGAAYTGPMYTAANPYQPGHTSPVNAGFDLGNGGHFSINFTPGVGQEYNPSAGDFQGASGHGQHQAGHGGHQG